MGVPTSMENVAIPELLAKSVSIHADRPAIVSGDRSVDFSTFGIWTQRVACALAEQGIKKGDRVALYAVNSEFFAVAYCGIVSAGATVVPINLLLTPKEIAYILTDAGAAALVYQGLFADHVRQLDEEGVDLAMRICIGDGRVADTDLDFAKLLQTESAPLSISYDPANDVAAILYTSGTTGKPKGAMLTHRNLLSNTCSIREALQLEPGNDILLVVLPMFHAFAATVGMLFPLLHGCTLVPVPKFDPEAVVRTIAAAKATIFLGVPSMYSLFLRLKAGHEDGFSTLRYAVSGGAAMPVEVMKQFEERFGIAIYEGDGPTECAPVTCVNPIGGVRKPGSVGLPVPLVEMKILGDGGKELPTGEIGEICVKGPNVMKGYWKRPEETQESFYGSWFRTGDLGHEDEDGYFYIVDRIKDMIIVNGMNVYPRVVEEVLYQCPAIREAAVVGEAHTLHGEIPIAYVALHHEASATAQEIRTHCQAHLGRHQVPRKVIFLSELPKNATGKIVKRELSKAGEVERGFTKQEAPPPTG